MLGIQSFSYIFHDMPLAAVTVAGFRSHFRRRRCDVILTGTGASLIHGGTTGFDASGLACIPDSRTSLLASRRGQMQHTTPAGPRWLVRALQQSQIHYTLGPRVCTSQHVDRRPGRRSPTFASRASSRCFASWVHTWTYSTAHWVNVW